MSLLTNRFDTYQPAPNLLQDRVILITGATGGLGSAAAKACAAHGATVVLLGRTIRKLEALYDEIERAGHPQPAIYPMNLEGASPKDYVDLATTLDEAFGRLDGLLHSAALAGTLTPLHLYDVALWSQVMQVNLNAPYLLTAATLPLLRNSSDASVIFSSAEVGRLGRAYWGAYAVSSAAVENMSQIWADELERHPNLRFNTLDPGAVRTPLRTRAYPGEDPNTLPLPEQLMPAYLWLLGPDSRGTTGQALKAQS